MNSSRKELSLLADQLQLRSYRWASAALSIFCRARANSLLASVEADHPSAHLSTRKGQTTRPCWWKNPYQGRLKRIAGKIQRRKEKWRIKNKYRVGRISYPIFFNEGEHATYFHVPQTHIPSPCNCSWTLQNRVNDFPASAGHEGIRHAVTQHNEQPRSQYVLVIVLNKSLRQLVHLRSYLVTFFLDFWCTVTKSFPSIIHVTFLALYLVSTVVERVFLYHKIIGNNRSNGSPWW